MGKPEKAQVVQEFQPESSDQPGEKRDTDNKGKNQGNNGQSTRGVVLPTAPGHGTQNRQNKGRNQKCGRPEELFDALDLCPGGHAPKVESPLHRSIPE